MLFSPFSFRSLMTWLMNLRMLRTMMMPTMFQIQVATPPSRDLKIIDNHLPHRVLKEKSLGIATAHSSDSTNSSKEQRSFSSSKMSSGHCSSVISCSDSSSEKTSHSSINVTSLLNTAKRSKKQYCLYCNKAISKLARHLESAWYTAWCCKGFQF